MERGRGGMSLGGVGVGSCGWGGCGRQRSRWSTGNCLTISPDRFNEPVHRPVRVLGKQLVDWFIICKLMIGLLVDWFNCSELFVEDLKIPHGPSHYRPSKSNNHITLAPSDNESKLAGTHTTLSLQVHSVSPQGPAGTCVFRA